jgi:hypothetical protein
VRDLRDECARTKARVEDPDERGARLHRQRSLRTWKGSDGSGTSGPDPPSGDTAPPGAEPDDTVRPTLFGDPSTA